LEEATDLFSDRLRDDDDDNNNKASIYEFFLTNITNVFIVAPFTKHLAFQNSILPAYGNASRNNVIRLAREAASNPSHSDEASSQNNRVSRCKLAKSSKFLFHFYIIKRNRLRK
jgi:hypothetical protein